MSQTDEGAFAHSLTDLMAGVAVTFLLIASIFIVQAAEARMREGVAAQKAKQQLKRIRTDDREARELLATLRDTLAKDLEMQGVLEASYDAKLDPYLLTITLDRSRFRFRSEECALDAGMREAIDKHVRRAVQRICAEEASSRRLLSITMEGHTDKNPFFPPDEKCGALPSRCTPRSSDPECERVGFENNVRLSASRAQSVFFELRQRVGESSDLGSCLDNLFVVSGRGWVEATGNDDVGRARDRRVVLKVRARAGSELTDDPDASRP